VGGDLGKLVDPGLMRHQSIRTATVLVASGGVLALAACSAGPGATGTSAGGAQQRLTIGLVAAPVSTSPGTIKGEPR
jgi:hypothetical protein